MINWNGTSFLNLYWCWNFRTNLLILSLLVYYLFPWPFVLMELPPPFLSQRGISVKGIFFLFFSLISVLICFPILSSINVIQAIGNLFALIISPLACLIWYADDIVIFGETSLTNVQSMLNVVEHFCTISGQSNSYSKSQIIFSKPLPSDISTFLFQEKGFPSVSISIKYLGYPFIKDGRQNQVLHQIILDIQNCISNWQHKLLSQMGRVIMIKSVLLALPTYLISCYKFPKGICSKLQSIVASF